MKTRTRVCVSPAAVADSLPVNICDRSSFRPSELRAPETLWSLKHANLQRQNFTIPLSLEFWQNILFPLVMRKKAWTQKFHMWPKSSPIRTWWQSISRTVSQNAKRLNVRKTCRAIFVLFSFPVSSLHLQSAFQVKPYRFWVLVVLLIVNLNLQLSPTHSWGEPINFCPLTWYNKLWCAEVNLLKLCS